MDNFSDNLNEFSDCELVELLSIFEGLGDGLNNIEEKIEMGVNDEK